MAASASSQHRCVFVGNIPYDATEEQLIRICEEVGPVVSFRLVIDRETGKPKGYGFCEYKDEETALSARRNLQGYEINGRQLRVDFAENDKNADRNREQGRGGPGLTSNAQRQSGGPSILGDSTLHQPIGLPLAATASSLMAGALGGAQTSGIQHGLQSQSGMGNDALTCYLAGMSRHQLNEIISEIKALATQNKPLARQLLQGNPQLPKALFQALIMLGMVTPQMMQMTSSLPSSILAPQPSSHLGQASSQKDALIGMLSRRSESQMPNVPQNTTDLQQSALLLPSVPVHPPHQRPLPHAQVLQGKIPGKHGATETSSIQPQPLGGPSIQPNPPVPASKGLIPQIHPPLQQHHARPTGAASLAQRPLLAIPNTSLQQSLLLHPSVSRISSSNYQLPLGGLEMLSKEAGTSASVSHDPTWASKASTQNLGVGLVEQTRMAGDASELMSRPSKIHRLEDGSGAPQLMNGHSSSNRPISGQTIGTGSVSVSQMTGFDGVQHSEKQMPQLTSEMESALLQQVLSLTPEQLSSLPVEQQQQVLQLQQMLSSK
ncbi:cleavage stimulating factor 64 [Elaeis guineensis]|uniref:Cleavage stimulating factor 64 isoform X2 n=1 Tax=Elaeis guineensis var. tenera TaxID=51953 RepID=A0A6J0PGF4_ELAGV|nr:cleavage stimulating factor 64 isoform X2 [Elaeis guineensis]XP_019703905.1 cleavage stimulating factor 64 isoform X2 [Elaeis guineensis]